MEGYFMLGNKLTKLTNEVKEAIVSGRWMLFSSIDSNEYIIQSDLGSWFIVDENGELISKTTSKPTGIGKTVIFPFNSPAANISNLMGKRA